MTASIGSPAVIKELTHSTGLCGMSGVNTSSHEDRSGSKMIGYIFFRIAMCMILKG